MAQIYLARQTGLGAFERHVVLKTILRERASDQRFVTMFLDEAKLAATLNHQNIAQVYEVDQADGAYFMAMEYVHGENARAILETTLRRSWTIPFELAVMIVSGAASGLHHAHERRGKNGSPLNIVHRDVSPANIMVGYDGSVKVLDFGIAKAEERATKTVGGTIKGKYGYMSPEQCKGKAIDRRSDIFALGICLYELTTLRRAFKGNDDFETMKRIVAGDVILPSVAVPGYPRELEAIVLTAMANDPKGRFQNGQEMIEALDAFAVRAKLIGSNTSMGRFMVQLFGAKREPWVEGPPGDHSEKTTVIGSATGNVDEEKTKVIEDRQQPAQPGSSPRIPVTPARAGTTAPMAMTGRRDIPSPIPEAQPADVSAWDTDSSRQGGRASRPVMTFDRPPPQEDEPLDELDMTLAGPPVVERRTPVAGITVPQRPPTELAAQSVVTDPLVSFHTDARLPEDRQGAEFRTALSRVDLRPHGSWILLALLMVIGLVGGIAIATLSHGSAAAPTTTKP